MPDDPKGELLELPADLREEALACGAPIELMGRIYQRGFAPGRRHRRIPSARCRPTGVDGCGR
jgi:hypothetical protein